jgi:hypothetical protein
MNEDRPIDKDHQGSLVELSKKYLNEMLKQNGFVASGDMEKANEARNARIDIIRVISLRHTEIFSVKLQELCEDFEDAMEDIISALTLDVVSNSEEVADATIRADAIGQSIILEILHLELEETEFLNVIKPLLPPQ